ncbi:24751_t:CDS:2, partial [Dentiscutata erythropus]
TTFSPDTTTIFESNTEQQFYQFAEVPENITDIHFPILTTEFSFSSNKLDTDSINELVLFRAPLSYLTEKQKQIRSSTPETIFNVEQGNLFNNNNNQVEYIPIYPTPIVNYWEVDQPQDRTEIDS